jgi:drug/metabolite transporter (DMT)-like permease
MPVEPHVVALVLVAAVLHALWNALVKTSGDRLLTTATVIGTGSLACAALVPLVEPPAPASWGFLALSVLVHNLYYACLLESYRLGDLSQVYPIARGTGPLLVALLSAPLAGEPLSAVSLGGVLLVTAGIYSLAAGRRPRARLDRAVVWALGTGILIAAFTLVDGLGVRRAQSPLGYIAWLEMLVGVPIGLVALARRGARLRPFLVASGARAAGGGVMATAAYGVVIWAYSRGALAPIAALRETSVILASLIGALALGEPFGRRRVVASVVVAVGAVLLNLPR